MMVHNHIVEVLHTVVGVMTLRVLVDNIIREAMSSAFVAESSETWGEGIVTNPDCMIKS